MRAPLPLPWLLIALSAVYFLAGKLGLSFATLHSSASAVWPPTGIALGAFLLFGHRAWPAIFLGAFLVNLTTAGSVFTSLGIAAGNTLEGIVGAFLVHRFAGGSTCFERARDVFKFAALAALAATTISATIGVSTLSLAGYAAWSDFGAIWLTWWLGDAAGALIVTPLLLLWYANPRPMRPGERQRESAPTLVVVTAVAAACFAVPVVRDYPLSFLCLPPIAWIAFRFGPREVATAIAVLAAIAVYATESGFGAFVMATRNESLLVLQSFMAMIALTMLPMAALVHEHRRARAQAEAATRARDEFLAMLSHELRNPLQAIANSLLALQRRGERDEVADRALGIARRQTEHLTHLVNDLLDVARASTGKIVLAREPVNLEDAVRRSIELFAGAGRLDSRELDVHAEPVWLSADPARLDQVVANLLSNALKFTPPGAAIRVSAMREGDAAVIRVRDEGIGIAAQLLPRVFDLFTQGERSLDRREGGLGIGLTLVRQLVELHGGTVEARSAGPDRGSEFVVRIPCGSPIEHGRDGPAPREQPTEPRRVLVVEDNADARLSLRAVLELEGHEVHEAADGETGIELALSVGPDVVLVDIGLPRIDGYEVARRLRAHAARAATRWRLIALTGYGMPDDVRKAREAGFDEHLVKPVDPVALRRAMLGRAKSPVAA